MTKIKKSDLEKIIANFYVGKSVVLDGLTFTKHINPISFENQLKHHFEPNQMTAMELCGSQGDCLLFKVGNSSVEWESITYRNCGKIRIQRLCESKEGGKGAFMGLNLKERYILPETIVTVVKNEL